MSTEILMNVTPRETRVAIVENGMLSEVFIERASRLGLVGNIYKGKVSRVLPGMQAAFIDVGLERTAFLHASDIYQKPNAESGEAPHEDINRLLHQGQTVLVQVIKDPIGTKGARLSTQISIAARYLVFMPDVDHIGVSQKIDDDAERSRLKELVRSLSADKAPGGYIIRTVAESIGDMELAADVAYLHKLWGEIQERAKTDPPESLIYEELRLVMRTMRDQVGSGAEIDRIRIDSRTTFDKVKKFAGKFIPEMAERIEYYPGERPLFDLYNVEEEIQRALVRKVELKSGGYLIIDQTEAMTTIDVNTGAFVGHRNLEETIFKTNLEATQAIVRQLRLRNLGGIIILDFIDMIDAEHRRQVLSALEKNLESDGSKSHISEVSDLGLVEMTRKRTRESLERVLCEPCPVCQGRGNLKTAETVCYEIFRELIREARQFDAQQLLVLASQDVVDLMVDEESNTVAELEEFINKPIKFQVESMYTQEQFDIVLM